MTNVSPGQPETQTSRRSLARRAGPFVAAAAVTASVIGVAVATSGSAPADVAAATSSSRAAVPSELPTGPQPPAPAEVTSYLAARSSVVSRSEKRVTLKRKPPVTGHRWMTGSLNLWPSPRERGEPITILKEGGRVAVTGVRKGGFAQIIRQGQVRWVNADYLATQRPVEPAPAVSTATPDAASGGTTDTASSAPTGASAGITSTPCPDGSGTESGLTSGAVTLFRSVCNAFPALSSYGGWDGHGEHASGKAIDFMVTSSSLGQAVADWARAHAGELNLYDVIWAQHIWTPVRSSEGWRAMPNRGSATANHFDHVHISVN